MDNQERSELIERFGLSSDQLKEMAEDDVSVEDVWEAWSAYKHCLEYASQEFDGGLFWRGCPWVDNARAAKEFADEMAE